jgi:hypothetical protein
MSQQDTDVVPVDVAMGTRHRFAYLDNLKVVLVVGVIVGHATMAWTGVGDWVFDEPHVRDPMLSVLILLAVIGALFAMPLFFLVAGAFTPGSLRRKGLRRFLIDRIVRLGLPMIFFVIFLSPVIEYVDPGSAGWDRGFASFALHIWWPPAPGPTWFLGVLLAFSIVYAVVRAMWPSRTSTATPPRIWQLAAAAAIVALVSYAVRFTVPLGVEVWRLALGQSPAWLTGFTLGVLGGERGWFEPIDPSIARRMRQVTWTAVAGCVVFLGAAMATEADIDDFGGGGTWQSLVTAAFEGVLVVGMPLWLMELFRRRFNRQNELVRRMSRAAYAAFVLHQLVLVGLVLATRWTPWPPEIEYSIVAVLGVSGSFLLASLVMRIPGVCRFI